MVDIQISLIISNLVNFINFFVFIIAPYAIFYFYRESDPGRHIPISIFILALGLDFIGISYLIRILASEVSPQFVLGSLSIGALLILASVLSLFYTKALEATLLRKRRDRIKLVIKNMQKRYYAKEITEEQLRNSYSYLLKELAEIELRLGKKRK